MSEKTRIEWCDATHNFWTGCQKVSPGCAACYADAMWRRYGKNFSDVRRVKDFTRPLRWERQMAAGTYQGKHHSDTLLVFTCSLSDFFIAEADPWRAEVWEIIRATPHLTYQVLTKRPGRIAACLPPDWGQGYPNVWLGVSVENPRYLPRLHALTQVPAVVHFVSFEPLLRDLGDLTPWLTDMEWAIVGGESGPRRRPMALEWMASIADQCQAVQIPVWIKQDAALRDGQQGRIPEALWQRKALPASVETSPCTRGATTRP